MAGWEIYTLEGIMSTAEGGIYNVISREAVEALLADNGALKLLAEHGYEVTPYINDIGEVVGHVIRKAASSNGARTAVSNTVQVLVKEQVVDQAMIDSVASGSIGAAADVGTLKVGETVSKVTLTGGGAGVGGTALSTVAGPAIAVGLGVGLGVLLYKLAPDFWTGVSEKLVAAGKTIGGKVLTFFDKDGNSYYDEETINIIKQALLDNGYLTDNPETIVKPTEDVANSIPSEILTQLHGTSIPISTLPIDIVWKSGGLRESNYSYSDNISEVYPIKLAIYDYPVCKEVSNPLIGAFFVSKNPFKVTRTFVSTDGSITEETSTARGIVMYDITYYTLGGVSWQSDSLRFSDDNNLKVVENDKGYIKWWIAHIVLTGTLTTSGVKPKPLPSDGTKDIPYGNPSSSDDKKKEVYRYNLPSNYPTPSDDPSDLPYDYYDPDPTANDKYKENPKKDPNPQPEGEPQDDPAPNPDPNKPSSNPTDDKPQDPPDPNPSDPDGGDPTPGIPILPIVASAGLGNIYNPSKAQVSALQSYLWSSDNLVDILKLFQNPVDGIISLHWVFGTPVDGDSKEITLGYLPTGVSAPVVTSQFTDIDCGTITIPLKQKNALDYPPYTDIQIYLPFIGIEPLNAYDLVGGTLNVTYRIDVYTGACVAKLTAKRNGLNCKLYEFAGNCGYELPLTSGNFVGMVGNVISGAVTGAMIGGVGGAVLGGARSAIHSNMDVRRSGNLSANAGICGSRIPYVIITRAVPYDAANYNMFYGYPSNKTVYLSNCKGYTKVKDIVLHTSATDEEKQEIESLLKEGVYL
jgi:hypothetical protein